MIGEASGAEKKAGYGYRELVVWQKAIELTKRIYSVTRRFPDEERFGLVSQMRRSAVSIPSNIAEGHAPHDEGVYPVCVPRRGFTGRTRYTTQARCGAWLLWRQRSGTDRHVHGGGPKNAQRPSSKSFGKRALT